jgi:hypothetical protein
MSSKSLIDGWIIARWKAEQEEQKAATPAGEAVSDGN